MITCFVYDGVIKGQFVYFPVYMKLSKVVSKTKYNGEVLLKLIATHQYNFGMKIIQETI